MKKPKLKRKIVRRVILGPRNLFNPEVLKDELDATGLELWGLVWHESWPVDLQLFAAGVGIADHMDGLYVGKLSRNAPADLSEGNQWLSSKFLDFGAIEARGERKTHTCMYIYTHDHQRISLPKFLQHGHRAHEIGSVVRQTPMAGKSGLARTPCQTPVRLSISSR